MRYSRSLRHGLVKYLWQPFVAYGLFLACVPNLDVFQLVSPADQMRWEAEHLPDADFLDETALYAWLYRMPLDAESADR